MIKNFSLGLLFSVQLLLQVCLWSSPTTTTRAHTTGAGSCIVGDSAVGSTHLTAGIIATGPVSLENGLLVSIDDQILTTDRSFPLPSTQTEVTLSLTSVEGFRGFSFILSGAGTAAELLLTDTTTQKINNLCTGDATSATHLNSLLKTQVDLTVSYSLSTLSSTLDVPLDITVVEQNSGDVSIYYYSQYTLQLVRQPATVMEVMEANANLQSFVAEVKTVPTVEGLLRSANVDLTVFAPWDFYFESALSQNERLGRIWTDPEFILHKEDLLFYQIHRLGRLTETTLISRASNLPQLQMANNELVLLLLGSSGDFVELNGEGTDAALILVADLQADNGLVHMTDEILIPASATYDILETLTLNTANEFSTLVELLFLAGLDGAAQSTGPMTMFAPNNAAFNRMDPVELEFLRQPENLDLLVDVLEYHVAPGVVSSITLLQTDPTLLVMVNGKQTTASVRSNGATLTGTITSSSVNSANFLQFDTLANNGIIHTISEVLIPGTNVFTIEPSSTPSSLPSFLPSGSPSDFPSKQPSSIPSSFPSSRPSDNPSSSPSGRPSDQPSKTPSSQPTGLPSRAPSSSPTLSASPTNSGPTTPKPSPFPSRSPSRQPSSIPSARPSSIPSSLPSSLPSTTPSSSPSQLPSAQPSKLPSSSPSISASPTGSEPTTAMPSSSPSSMPSSRPSDCPSAAPSTSPSISASPTASTPLPSTSPSENPSRAPSGSPSMTPSDSPTVSVAPTISSAPTTSTPRPTTFTPEPSSQPTRIPTATPSVAPTITTVPSASPTASPSITPTVSPSGAPSNKPTPRPTFRPATPNPTSGPPSQTPRPTTKQRTLAPTKVSEAPSASPSYVPSQSPTIPFTLVRVNSTFVLFNTVDLTAEDAMAPQYGLSLNRSFRLFVENVVNDVQQADDNSQRQLRERRLAVSLLTRNSNIYNATDIECPSATSDGSSIPNNALCQEAFGEYFLQVVDEDPLTVQYTYSNATVQALEDGKLQDALDEVNPYSPFSVAGPPQPETDKGGGKMKWWYIFIIVLACFFFLLGIGFVGAGQHYLRHAKEHERQAEAIELEAYAEESTKLVTTPSPPQSIISVEPIREERFEDEQWEDSESEETFESEASEHDNNTALQVDNQTTVNIMEDFDSERESEARSQEQLEDGDNHLEPDATNTVFEDAPAGEERGVGYDADNEREDSGNTEDNTPSTDEDSPTARESFAPDPPMASADDPPADLWRDGRYSFIRQWRDDPSVGEDTEDPPTERIGLDASAIHADGEVGDEQTTGLDASAVCERLAESDNQDDELRALSETGEEIHEGSDVEGQAPAAESVDDSVDAHEEDDNQVRDSVVGKGIDAEKQDMEPAPLVATDAGHSENGESREMWPEGSNHQDQVPRASSSSPPPPELEGDAQEQPNLMGSFATAPMAAEEEQAAQLNYFPDSHTDAALPPFEDASSVQVSGYPEDDLMLEQEHNTLVLEQAENTHALANVGLAGQQDLPEVEGLDAFATTNVEGQQRGSGDTVQMGEQTQELGQPSTTDSKSGDDEEASLANERAFDQEAEVAAELSHFWEPEEEEIMFGNDSAMFSTSSLPPASCAHEDQNHVKEG